MLSSFTGNHNYSFYLLYQSKLWLAASCLVHTKYFKYELTYSVYAQNSSIKITGSWKAATLKKSVDWSRNYFSNKELLVILVLNTLHWLQFHFITNFHATFFYQMIAKSKQSEQVLSPLLRCKFVICSSWEYSWSM